MVPLSRRQLLALGGALAVPMPAMAARSIAMPSGLPWAKPQDDPVADIYHRVLHLHTRWVEQQWDPTIDAYRAADFRFAAVLGNAVLLTIEDYDAELAGVDHATLKERTIATIQHFAGTNRLAGGDEWGRQLFWDSTFELYFVLAARMLWSELDDATRLNVRAITAGQAAYAYGLGFANDPMSGGWTPNGTRAAGPATPSSRRWASTRRPSRPGWPGDATMPRCATGSCSGRRTPARCRSPTGPTSPGGR